MLRPRGFPETRPSLIADLRDAGPAPSAWRDFFDRYAPSVFRVARLRGLGTDDADDIVQQVMLAVSDKIAGFSYDTDRGTFRNWIRRIAENKITDFVRQRQSRRRAESGAVPRAHENSIESAWHREWQLQDLLWCLDRVAIDFAPRRVEAFRLYVIEGVAAADVSRRLEIPVGHVYVIRAQIINRIRKEMQRLRATEDGA